MHDDGTGFFAGLGGVTLEVLTGFDEAGHPIISPAGTDAAPRPALSLVPLGPEAKGREVAVAQIETDSERALILGLLQPPARQVEADGSRVEISAEREVVLRCGKASIRLSSDGRVTVRGTRILSRSDGPNRVQGASVELN